MLEVLPCHSWIQSNLEIMARDTTELKVPIRSHNPRRELIARLVCALSRTNNVIAVDNREAEKVIVGS